MSDLPERIGRYEVLEELGRGGMGVVYKARDPNIGRLVAIKKIELSFPADDKLKKEMQERFKREAKAAGVLHDHPNIVTVFDVQEEEGSSYIVMQFVEGETLEEVMKPGEKLPLRQINDLVRQVAEGLAFAHGKGVIHRDIKPANIVVTKEGVAKIMDFGIAHTTGSELTQRGTVLGSPSYMSPEQVTGHAVDQRSDIFGLGVILYQLLTGERPFPGESATVISYRIVREEPPEPSAVNPIIPPSYDTIIKKSLAKNPADRYNSALEMAQDLARVAEGNKLEAAGEDKTRPLRPTAKKAALVFQSLWKQTWFKWAALAGAGLVLMLTVVLVSLSLSNPSVKVDELIKDKKHDQAVIALLGIVKHKPKDHYAYFLLGQEYAQLGDFGSSLKCYEQALIAKPDYRDSRQLLDDLMDALKQPPDGEEAKLALGLIKTRIKGRIKDQLKKALQDQSDQNYNHNLIVNAEIALAGMDEKIDEVPYLLLDLRLNPDLTIRKTAAEKLGELRDPRAITVLDMAKNDRRNNWSVIQAIEEAKKKILEAHPPEAKPNETQPGNTAH